MKTTKIIFIGCLALGTLLVSCSGDDGEKGPPGESIKGDPGDPGADGLSCWDTNKDGIKDNSEDINQDGSWDALDCQGEQGPQGDQGIFEFYFTDFEGLPDSNPPSEFVQSDVDNADWLVTQLDLILNSNASLDYVTNSALINNYIADNQFTEISIAFTSSSTSLVEFDISPSTEDSYDYGLWLLNGEVVQGISGILEEPITIRFTAPAGDNVLTFRYEKDDSLDDGLDLIVIDNLMINNVSNVGKVNLNLPELPEGASYYTEKGAKTK
ncbi:hypothetical protein [Allomuricauda sp. NBRC 101325]|uniref:hypothetical protein n=1 Tax=Allomuricauda sp. NBRC 101325 TaxID=1113758 RepID=UPI0024A291B2|nr:hypothetical protein [Muricauda sp. NBRC 101325]GLU44457.1 hypothetical protein Musp01_20810 [Muricauda sp. NBRC 101325]